MRDDAEPLLRLAEDISEDVDAVVLFGMGGSSLAPEVMRVVVRRRRLPCPRHDPSHSRPRRSPTASTWSARSSSPPRSPARRSRRAPTPTTSGSSRRAASSGSRSPTPARRSQQLANERAFAAVVPGEPTIGGRYSALSPFGIVPAAADGRRRRRRCSIARPRWRTPAASTTATRASSSACRSARAGWKAATRSACPDGESSGSGSSSCSPSRRASRARASSRRLGRPRTAPTASCRRCGCRTRYELGQEFFRWEFATAVAGSMLAINPFDQPDVQAAKDKTNEVLAGGDVTLEHESSIDELLAGAAPPRLRLHPGLRQPDARERGRILALAGRLGERTGCVVTHGFGPRYLHSTGQLHKGGPNTGRFLQIVEDYGPELADPRHALRLRPADPRAGGRRLRVPRASAAGASPASNSRRFTDAARNDRPRPHGREHDRPARA